MTISEQLDIAADKLNVYDVEQGAWEHEGEGFEANATHVLFHLAKDLVNKDFSSGDEVQHAIASDSVQYALRLMRWTGQQPHELRPDIGVRTDVRLLARSFGGMEAQKYRHSMYAVVGANAALANVLHEQDHASDERSSVDVVSANMYAGLKAGKLLTYSAVMQAAQFEFDLFEAFDQRLANLRKRFGVPEPETA